MKVPIKWLKELVPLPKDQKILTDKLTMAGHMLDKTLEVNGETVVDLELRGNRADCYSILGIAREVAAIFNVKLKKLETLNIVKTTNLKTLKLNADKKYVKRVGIIEIKNVKIEKSPKWLHDRLIAYGVEPINNIVDLTNYVMIETGEPMHAFDADKVGKNLTIRLAKSGEKLTTFTDSTIELTSDDLVWAKGNEILSVAGAIGEKYHSISETTSNVLLEAANYDRANIRRSVHNHKLLTEAGIRHEKELDPNLVELAVGRYLYFIKKYKWGEFTPKMMDYYPNPIKPWRINLDINRVKDLGGVEIPDKEIVKILSALSFNVEKKPNNILDILVPTYRTDVKLEEDVIEEILRIYGYENIPVKTLSLEIPKNITPDYILQEQNFRNSGEALSMDEVINSPFVKNEDAATNTHPFNSAHKTVSLINPPSGDTSDLRQSLLINLKSNCRKIRNERGEVAGLFEIGKVYSKFNKNYIETRKFALAYWNKSDRGFSYFKGLLNGILSKVGIPEPQYSEVDTNLGLINSFKLSIRDKEIGYGGVTENIYFAEIDLPSVLDLPTKYKISLWPKFPPQIEDITFTLPKKTRLGDLISEIKAISPLVTKVQLKDEYENSFTFRIEYQSELKTLENYEVDKERSAILSHVSDKFQAIVK